MVYTIEELKRIIRPIAVKYDLPAVYVFGSYARNEATEESDVDILVEKPSPKTDGIFRLTALYCALEEGLNKKIDLLTTYALNDCRDKLDEKFRNEVMSERVALYD